MKKNILAIIPCRSGSKGLKNKNIIKVFGRPLVYYSIYFAQQCKFINKIIVSTDSKIYKNIAKKYGILPTPTRPKKISKNNSLDIDFVKFELNYLKKNENYIPDIVVILRPTSPLRKIKILKKAVNIIVKNKKIDSVRSISEMNKTIYKSWKLNKGNYLSSVIKNDSKFKEPYNAPRQELKKFYYQNAVYDLFNVKVLNKNLLSGKNIYGILTDENIDIDSFKDVQNLMNQKKKFINFKKFIKN